MRKIETVIGLTAMLAADMSFGHHSYAMFEMGKVDTVGGVLKVLEWTNPHVWVWVDVEDPKSKATVTYGFESLSPGQLQRDYGWDRRSLKPGDTVSVDYAPLKSGNAGGALIRITLPSRRTLGTRFTAPRETAAQPEAAKK
ncbi:MAG TPA: DUF6152 family protein [Steroidobacteraceae bacterium]|nr:DUF6152 family protein [Steroidobacteraceae bacterium]